MLQLTFVVYYLIEKVTKMKQRKFLTRFEVNAILKQAKEGRYPERDYCMFLMCFLHGFRVSELCNLTLSDIDLESRILYVNGSFYHKKRDQFPVNKFMGYYAV